MSDVGRGLFGGFKELTSTDGRTVQVAAESPELRISDGVNSEVLPLSSAGYGGHELVLSPDEELLVVWLYSGQSEIGYELFDFNPLRHLRSFPYVVGEGSVPVFSEDSRLLAMASSRNTILEIDEAGVEFKDLRLSHDALVDWATVHLLNLEDDDVFSCQVSVQLRTGFPVDHEQDYYPEIVRCSATDVQLATGWGSSVELPIPLPPTVVIEGPPTAG